MRILSVVSLVFHTRRICLRPGGARALGVEAPSGSLLAKSARTGELNSGRWAALPRRPDVGDETGTDCLAARELDAGFDLGAAGLLEATCDALEDLAGVPAVDPRFERREVGEDMLAAAVRRW